VAPARSRYSYDVTADGQQFLVADRTPVGDQQSTSPMLTVVVNWTAALKE